MPYDSIGLQLVTAADVSVLLRPAQPAELDAINAVVERAVMSWSVPERVKRLALPSYRYSRHDLEVFAFIVAGIPRLGAVGIAALEPADRRDIPRGVTGIYLHGLYVDPELHRRGIGTRLFAAALDHARKQGADGLLVKAQRQAEAFFRLRKMQPLERDEDAPSYPRRYWLPIDARLDAA
jgi:GNAT superfamily N-acetyltransferase